MPIILQALTYMHIYRREESFKNLSKSNQWNNVLKIQKKTPFLIAVYSSFTVWHSTFRGQPADFPRLNWTGISNP